MYRQPVVLRYSFAFKRKVVEEIESGKLTLADARRVYDIRGCATINGWLEKMGKNHLTAKVVRIEMKDEKDQLQELKKQKKALESALAQAHLKCLALETLVEVAGNRLNVDLKKTFGEKAPKK